MKNPFKSSIISLVFLSSANLALGDVYTWNGSTTGTLGGSDNEWNTTTPNWTGATTSWPSTSTTDDDASFGGTAGTVTLTTTVTANDITFATGGYTVGADNTTGIIILDGTNPTITGVTGSLSSIGAKIQGSSGLTKAGSATIQFRGVSTYTGDTRILRGNLLIGAGNNRLPTGTKLIIGDPVNNTNGVLQMNSRSQQVGGLETAGTSTGNRVINSSATASTFTVSNAADHTFGGILGGTGTNDNNYNFTKSGAGRLSLTSTNTYTGTTTISGGILELGHATNTLFDTGLVNVNGGTLDITDKNETVGALTVTSGSITSTTGTLSAPSCAGKAGTISAILAGTVNLSGTDTTWLTKDTAGTLTLAASNTFTGNIVVTAGRLTLANSNALGVADPAPAGTNRKGLVMQGGSRSLWLKGGITIPTNIDFFVSSNSNDGGGINNESDNNEIQSPLYFSVGNAALNISSAAGTLVISGNITMTQTARTLYLGGVSVNDNTISGDISESTANIMPLIKQNTGKWILSGTNTYKGDTTVNGGTLVFANGGSQKFYPKSDASSNKITGNGATATFDGAFEIDLSDAILAPDLTSWLLIDVDNVIETFDTNFSVTGFTETALNSGIWKKTEAAKTLTFTESDGRLVISPAVATNTFADWLVINTPATGFATDSDNDGVSNGLENVFGTDPNAFSAGLANISATGSSATYTHTLNPNIASDVSYAYEWSTDLVEWKTSGGTNTSGTTATITPSAPLANVVTVTTNITAGPATGIFTRIKATQP
jgi:autotransporter-associated beta strand protein